MTALTHTDPVRPVADSAEAQALLAQATSAIDSLLKILEEETKLVRAGHLVQASTLENTKSDLARAYAKDAERVKFSRDIISRAAPAALNALRGKNAEFEQALQTNMRVLATAHAVSEGIIRGVSEEINRKAAPQTYGASGRHNAPVAAHAQPIAVSRVL